MFRASSRLRHEAGGTSRIKIMMDGPRAIATRDGATIEMAPGPGAPRDLEGSRRGNLTTLSTDCAATRILIAAAHREMAARSVECGPSPVF
jgi:hypothetical protein